MYSILLLILGLILLLLEFYLPGAIMGTLGAILIFASVLIFASNNNSTLEVFAFFAAAIVGVIAVVRFAVWQIPRGKKESIYLDKDQGGFKASTFDPTAIGKTGVALSDLKPGGFVLIEGKKHQALSIAGYITKGSTITVISGQEESLIVKNLKEETP